MSVPDKVHTDMFTVTFWGSRGTRMVSDKNHIVYGKDTICVEVQCGSRTLVFDAGSGIISLGESLIKRNIDSIDLFLSHSHYDHVEGIPFFQPFYNTDFSSTFWSGRLNGITHSRDIVDGLMKEPYFPIKQEKFLSKIRYKDISDFETLQLGDEIEIETKPLNHPGKATGYRVNFKGRSFAFITDTTHVPNKPDEALIEFIRDVDLFAYDCSYTDKEFPKFATYGHSTWEEAIRLKNSSRAKAMAGLHHMPFRTDKALDKIAEMLKTNGKGCRIARDGLKIQL